MSLWRLAIAVVVVYACKPWRVRRYRKLLARIEALEVELGMREAPTVFGPGAKWLVNEPGAFQHVTSSNYTVIHKVNLSRDLFYGSKEEAA